MATTSAQSSRGSRLAVVMDPIEAIHPAKDTTLALLLEAQRRGYHPYYVAPAAMWAGGGAAWARVQALQVRDSESDWFSLGDQETVPLGDFDLILMRKDPPFDQEYIYLTYLLELAETAGARVVNRPRALRDYNEKASILKFPELTPPTLIACDIESFREFHRLEEHIVIKPLDGMGGRGVFVLGPGDTNLSSVVEMLTENGTRHAMAQRYLPAIRQGDKRVLVVAGNAVPYMLARLPATGESTLLSKSSECARGLSSLSSQRASGGDFASLPSSPVSVAGFSLSRCFIALSFPCVSHWHRKGTRNWNSWPQDWKNKPTGKQGRVEQCQT